MKARVQSLYYFGNSIYDSRIVAIWRRSAPDSVEMENRRQWKPLSPGLEEWIKNPKSDFGLLYVQRDGYYFWANWLETNRGLIPVLDPEVFGVPCQWRLKIELGEEEKEKIFLISEPSSENSVFIYRLNEATTSHFLLFFDKTEKSPQLIKTELQLEDAPQWLRKKVAAIVEERSPQAALHRMEGLKNRLGKLLKGGFNNKNQ